MSGCCQGPLQHTEAEDMKIGMPHEDIAAIKQSIIDAGLDPEETI